MVIWGAIWGAILGWLWPGHGFLSNLSVLGGALLGAAAGLTLRKVVRSEIAARQAGSPASAAKSESSNPLPLPASAPVAAASAEQAATAPEAQPMPAQPEPATVALASISAGATTGAAIAGEAKLETPADNKVEPWPDAPAKPSGPDPVTLAFDRFKSWLFGGNTVVRMGLLVLFVGLAFLAKFAAENALLPPELRLAAIAAAGIALFFFGFRLRLREGRQAYALSMQGAGVAVLYLTVFAAFRLYQFLPSGAAFAMLALVCAFSAAIALAQNSMAMAFIGFAGGFAAPLLVSSGSGNHVGLFGYYLALNLAIVGMAWFKAWRALNLLGFFATFAVATLWGVLKYQEDKLESTEPFLIAFFLIYLVASLLYATRHSLAAKKAVDATLVFGTPIVAFALQSALVRQIEYATAFSALALGTLYLGLGWWMFKSRPTATMEEAEMAERALVQRWLAECYAALGLGFATLAVPLALDSHLTSAVWAAEGAAIYWMGQRQGRWLARAAGLALQVLAALAYLHAHGQGIPSRWALANATFVGACLLAGSAIAIAYWARARTPSQPMQEGPFASFAAFEARLSPVLFWIGFLWWQIGLSLEIGRVTPNAQGIPDSLFSDATQVHLSMLAWVASAFLAQSLTRSRSGSTLASWPIANTPAWFVLPVLALAVLHDLTSLAHVFEGWGGLFWPLCIGLHLLLLRRLDDGPPKPWWPWVHAGGVWLLVLLGANLLMFGIETYQLWQSAWSSVILLVSGLLVLLALCARRWFDAARREPAPWPLDRFARSYLWTASAPLAAAVALGALVVSLSSNGDARPLPFVPLLNPTDLSVALALAACALWLLRQREADYASLTLARHAAPTMILTGIGFIAINGAWLRVAHHYAGVPWDADQLFDSFLVQAGYSILWTLLAMGLMVLGWRRALRKVWMLGAALMGLTVLKLFLIDLSNRGGSERIVVFIAVGVLMLVIGYFAPMPPSLAQPKPTQPDTP